MKKILRYIPAFLAVLCAVCLSAFSSGAVQAQFKLGCEVSDMLYANGSFVSDGNNVYYTDESDYNRIYTFNESESELVCKKNARLLNLLDGTLYFISELEEQSVLYLLTLSDNTLTCLKSGLPKDIAQLYVTNRGDVFYKTNSSIFSFSLHSGEISCILQKENLLSFVPTEYGLVYAVGDMFDFALFAQDTVVCDSADSYDVNISDSLIIFSQGSQHSQTDLSEAFSGKVNEEEYTGIATVNADVLFSDMTPDSSYNEAEVINKSSDTALSSGKNTSKSDIVKNRKPVSNGVENTLKRAEQLNNINWTPKKDIYGWDRDYVYKAGQTYTGLPYGQPVAAKYVPWNASFKEFLDAVNNPNSLMYTKYSYNAGLAPYYSVDCSAYVSWTWMMNERHTTVGIPNKATLISNNSYSQAKVGDAICKSKVHVVLITDITYDQNGTINSITISEASPKEGTDFCCQKTSYGAGHELTLSDFNKKYFFDGYKLYRNPKADSVTYKHYCEIILDGDSCSVCGVGKAKSLKPFNATLTVSGSYAIAYSDCSDRCTIQKRFSNGKNITVTHYAKNGKNEVWYQIKGGGWIFGSGLSYKKLNSSAEFESLSLPSGEIPFNSDPDIKGILSCSNLINSITFEVFLKNDLSSKPVMSYKKGKTSDGYNISGTANKKLDFSTLSAGKYRLKITVKEYSYSPFIKQTVYALSSVYSDFTVLDDPRCTSWSIKYPKLVDPQFVETATGYRYSDLVTVVSDKKNLSGHTLVSTETKKDKQVFTGITSWPAGFDKSSSVYKKYDLTGGKISSGDNTSTSSKTKGYIYYHWCRYNNLNGPSNKSINRTKTSEYGYFHAFYSTSKPSSLEKSGSCYKYSNKSACKCSYWYYAVPVKQITATTKTTQYTYTRRGAWSAWSLTEYEASDTRAVKSATVYRYNDKVHTWDEGIVQKQSTCSENGLSIHTCSHCEMIKNQPLPLKEHNLSDTFSLVKPATQTESGIMARLCTSCTYYGDEQEISAVDRFVLSFEKRSYNGKKQTPYLFVYDKQGNRLKYKTDYTVKYPSQSCNVGKYTLTVNFKGNYEGQKQLSYCIVPSKPSGITAKQTPESITLSWQKSEQATCYRIYLYNSSTKTYTALKTTTGTKYTHENLVSCKAYIYAVKAYTKTSDGYFYSGLAVFRTATKPLAPALSTTSSASGTAKITWTRSPGVTGYQVYIYNEEKGKFTKLSNSTSRSFTIKNLPSKSYQYIKVRAYRKAGTSYVYSDFSNTLKIRIK